jgi:hypothetical protein
MNLMRRLASGAAVTTLALAAASAVYAQETTGGIRGQITDDSGAPVGGATVTITNEATGATSTTVTNGDGGYDVRALQPGGPYLVSATEGAHAGVKVRVPSVGVGSVVSLNLTLAAAGGSVSELVVTATPKTIKEVTTGPVTMFSSVDVDTLPSFQRDLKDLVRLNPFVTLDPTNFNALMVAGSNNRVNTIYIDGVKQADDFGLNANGYPSQRSPISTDWVSAFNFEVAPYDVDYGEFQGGVLNVVTKGGSNNFHGAAYYEYDGSQYAAKHYTSVFIDPATGQKRTALNRTFSDRTYGFWADGPIIPGKLFFFGGYERYDGTSVPNTFGPVDSTAANKVNGLTTADLNTIINTIKTVYGFDPLGYDSGPLPTKDQKYFARFDWNITDRQRAMFSYQEDDGATLSNGGSNSATNLSLLSQYFNTVQTLKVWNGQLFSQWSDSFSTELAYNRKEIATITAPLAGNTFAQFVIRLNDGATGAGALPSATVTVGPDISRQANVLNNTDQLFRIRAHYKLDNNTFTIGYEREQLSVFNLFDQNANGAYIFSGNTSTATSPLAPNCRSGNVFTDLANKNACSLNYANAASNVKTDAAANWADVTNTLYIQDELALTPELTVRGGFRIEWYTNSTVPTNNPRFLSEYGITNTHTFDGSRVVMPRLGFNWRPDATLTVSGGIGLFSGGSPNVWLSNSFTNTGLLIGNVSCAPTTGNCSSALSGVDGFNVGAAAKAANTANANAGAGIINAVDPNFKPPAVWKASVSVVKIFDLPFVGADWRVHGDYLYQRVENGITWVDLFAQNSQLATAPDGRPTYNNNRYAAGGDVATGKRAGYDLLLTNSRGGQGKIWALGFGKTWRDGWFQGFDFDLTYTHQDVTEVNPGTSSVAASNYSQWAIANRNSNEVAISNYQVKYQTKLQLNYSRAFFGDYKTSIRFYAQRRAGLPFSYTFRDASTNNSANAGEQMFGETQAVATRNTQLLYVPQADATGHISATSDPRVTYNTTSFPAGTIAAFDTYLHDTGLIKYAGTIAPRNVFKSRDVTTVDLRFEQELPAFIPHGARFKAYMDIINLGNLLNKNWGVLEQYGFPGVINPITAVNCQANAPTPATCQAGPGNYYQYNQLFGTTTPAAANGFGLNNKTLPTLNNASAWYLKFGIKYQF